jgi:hypothetical protein
MSSIGLMVLLAQLSGNLYAEFGPDINSNTYLPQYFTVGYTDKLTDILDYQMEVGGWRTDIQSEQSSFYSSYQVGFVAGRSVYARAFTGVAAITQTDSRLSSPFQFKHDVGVGVKNKRNVGIGINYSHVSNAGFKMPNLGRDFIQLRVELPFN